MTVAGAERPDLVPTVFVTACVLRALSVPPLLGRWLTSDDEQPGAASTAMLSQGYWQRRYGFDPSVIGRSITIDSRPVEIVGVMPKEFRIPGADADLIAPIVIDRSSLTLPPFGGRIVARLKPGVTIAEANADVARMLPIWMDSWPYVGDARVIYGDGWRIAPALRSLKEEVVGNVGNVLWVIMGTIGIVLLIACANVANLMLVRMDARRRELAVRAALGAGALQISRTLLAESVGLALLGGGLGAVLAFGGVELLAALGPSTLPRLDEIAVDWRALGFATIAIRLALGAQQRAVRRSFVRDGLTLACVGVGLGVVAAAAVTRLMSSLLFGVRTLDPLTYLGAALLLVLVAACASYLPARRASAVDPNEVLAAE